MNPYNNTDDAPNVNNPDFWKLVIFTIAGVASALFIIFKITHP